MGFLKKKWEELNQEWKQELLPTLTPEQRDFKLINEFIIEDNVFANMGACFGGSLAEFGIIPEGQEWWGDTRGLLDEQGDFIVPPELTYQNQKFCRIQSNNTDLSDVEFIKKLGLVGKINDHIAVLEQESTPEYLGILPANIMTQTGYSTVATELPEIMTNNKFMRIKNFSLYKIYMTDKRLILSSLYESELPVDFDRAIFLRPTLVVDENRRLFRQKPNLQTITDDLKPINAPNIPNGFQFFYMRPQTSQRAMGYYHFVALPKYARVTHEVLRRLPHAQQATLAEEAGYMDVLYNRPVRADPIEVAQPIPSASFR
jgi:hypothetical protein